MSEQEFSVIFHLVLTIFFHISFHFKPRWVYFGNKIVFLAVKLLSKFTNYFLSHVRCCDFKSLPDQLSNTYLAQKSHTTNRSIMVLYDILCHVVFQKCFCPFRDHNIKARMSSSPHFLFLLFWSLSTLISGDAVDKSPRVSLSFSKSTITCILRVN